jgi:two-component sensor histidine kinase
VARSGNPERFETAQEVSGRHFEVYAFRTGPAGESQVAILLDDITDRRLHEEQQQLLVSELNHRVKNTLATVLSIANQTLSKTDGSGDFVERFQGRVLALAEAHTLLSSTNWAGAEFGQLIRIVLAADEEGERVSLSGPVVLLPAQTALSLSLVLYELSTNARKYGALASASGRLSVSWTIANRAPAAYLEMDWRESGGPAVQVPERRGFGRGLIENSLQGVGGKSMLRFDPAGVRCRIEVPLPRAQGGNGGK